MADPATFLASNCSGDLIFLWEQLVSSSMEKRVDLTLYDYLSYTVNIQIWVWISSPKPHSAPLKKTKNNNTSLPLSPTRGLSLWYVSKLYASPVGAAQGESRNHRAIVSPVWRSEKADRAACGDLKKGGGEFNHLPHPSDVRYYGGASVWAPGSTRSIQRITSLSWSLTRTSWTPSRRRRSNLGKSTTR